MKNEKVNLTAKTAEIIEMAETAAEQSAFVVEVDGEAVELHDNPTFGEKREKPADKLKRMYAQCAERAITALIDGRDIGSVSSSFSTLANPREKWDWLKSLASKTIPHGKIMTAGFEKGKLRYVVTLNHAGQDAITERAAEIRKAETAKTPKA